MQFRERRRVIQVIRTLYDPAIKRGRSEVVGSLDQANPMLDDALRAACRPDEIAEITEFLQRLRERQSRQAGAEAVQGLPAQMRLAESWLRQQNEHEIGPLAAEIWTAWSDLSKALHKTGIGKSKHRD